MAGGSAREAARRAAVGLAVMLVGTLVVAVASSRLGERWGGVRGHAGGAGQAAPCSLRAPVAVPAKTRDVSGFVFPGVTDSAQVAVVVAETETETGQEGAPPTVLTHGMGDACSNPGFAQLTRLVSARTKSVAVCVGAGPTQAADTINTFATTMDAQVEYFAQTVRADARLAKGFNALGLSQGNLVIRAYVHRYNDPPVLNFLSVHGPHAGVASFPRCDPVSGVSRAACDAFDALLGDLAYSRGVQSALAQANFFRDPLRIKQYLAGCTFLVSVLDKPSAEARTRFASLKRVGLVQAKQDTMLWPRETAHFGAYHDGSSWKDASVVVGVTHQPWFESLGLKDLAARGGLKFLDSVGDHLQFSSSELYRWMDEVFGVVSQGPAAVAAE